MATNTAVAPAPISLNTAEKLVAELHDRSLGEGLAASCFNDLNSVDFTLTSAQILALNATPVTVMLAPSKIPTVENPTTISTTANVSPGYVIVLERCVMYYKAGTVAYTINGCTGFSLQQNSVEMIRLPVTGIIDQSTDQMAVGALEAPAAVGIKLAANTGVTVAGLTASPTLGNGTVSLRIFYSLVPANF